MQKSFADQKYAAKRKTTRRERFLAERERITPRSELLAALSPFYPKGEGRGRPPIGLEKMLRTYIVQQSLGLSDEGIEDALYDSQAIRQFVGLDLGRESAPDATTLLKFRHFLETHKLTETTFPTIKAPLASQGLMLREGTIVDATIIAAPSSTKNQKGERDPEMHQAKKGTQWHFGLKAHIGADADSGLVHTAIGTAANVNDVTQAQALLHGEEQEGFGDTRYQGAEKRPEAQGKVRWNIALRPGKRRALDMGKEIDRLRDQLETIKARIRAKVEHPFHIIKNRFGLKKVRYRGLAKTGSCQIHHSDGQPLWLAALMLVAALVVAKPVWATAFVVQNEAHLQHAHALVSAALEAAGMPADFVDAPLGNEQRNLFMVSEGYTHVDMMPATPARLKLVAEGRLRMIPIPLDRGLLGYRINLLPESARNKLANVKTASDLSAFTIGQHVGWADVDIYRSAGISTKEIKTWANGEFAEQMDAGFIDLFPLGLEETLSYFLPHFRQRYAHLIADPHILVRYPWFRFVWVSPKADSDKLYMALQRGFDILAANGRFLKIWSRYRKPPPEAFFRRRVIVDLDNPFYDYRLVPPRYRHLLFRRVSR